MRTIVLASLLACLSTICSAQNFRDINFKDIGRTLLASAARSGAQKMSTDDFRKDVEKAFDKRNAEQNKGFRSVVIPDDAVVTVEIDSNQTRFTDEKLAATTKSEIQYWGKGLKIGINFNDRERLAERNARDRGNRELRNPIRPGRAERPEWDIHVTAREAQGFSRFQGGASLGRRTLFNLLGIGAGSARLLEEVTYIELELDIRRAAEQTSDAGAIISVIGADISGHEVNLDLDSREMSLSYNRQGGNNAAYDLFDALARATKVFRGETQARLAKKR